MTTEIAAAALTSDEKRAEVLKNTTLPPVVVNVTPDMLERLRAGEGPLTADPVAVTTGFIAEVEGMIFATGATREEALDYAFRQAQDNGDEDWATCPFSVWPATAALMADPGMSNWVLSRPTDPRDAIACLGYEIAEW